MLPLTLLRSASNHPMSVELKNGETYNGHLIGCDNYMNISLRQVLCVCNVFMYVCMAFMYVCMLAIQNSPND